MKCESCGTENLVGELLCRNCGELIADLSFLVAGIGETKPINQSIDDVLDGEGPKQITVEVKDGTIFRVPVWDGVTIILGRGKINPTRVPTLDLSAAEDEESGVSRQHAVIQVQGGLVLLADMGSTNGTFLNGRQLVPNAPSILSSGDTVIFGRLETRVIFS